MTILTAIAFVDQIIVDRPGFMHTIPDGVHQALGPRYCEGVIVT